MPRYISVHGPSYPYDPTFLAVAPDRLDRRGCRLDRHALPVDQHAVVHEIRYLHRRREDPRGARRRRPDRRGAGPREAAWHRLSGLRAIGAAASSYDLFNVAHRIHALGSRPLADAVSTGAGLYLDVVATTAMTICGIGLTVRKP
jgi:hypothetical protein